MISLFAAIFLATSSVADAHPARRGHNPAAHAIRHRASVPSPPSRAAVQAHSVTYHRHRWTYPHSNPTLIWRYVPGHRNLRGVWIAGHWRVVIKR